MKRMLCAVLAGIVAIGLTACGKTAPEPEATEPMTEPTSAAAPAEEERPELVSYSVYVPNDNADGFDVVSVETEEISVDAVLDELKSRNILPDGVAVNSFCVDGGLITVDFNRDFADVVCSMGTSGELMVVGSVVNSLLDAFGADTVSFTVDGQILESGHTIYDFPLSFFALR